MHDNEYIAHKREKDSAIQLLSCHLQEVSLIAKNLAAKINVPEAGELIGLIHDFGKYSKQFQDYIKSGTGLYDADHVDYVDAKGQKGKIDHSTAGAQWVWREIAKNGTNGNRNICAQILALCIASHHSGLIDCLQPDEAEDGKTHFGRRMGKPDDKTNFDECCQNAHSAVMERARQLADKPLLLAMLKQLNRLREPMQHDQEISEKIQAFYVGFWTRFLFSCLIDADRINSADFEEPGKAAVRNRIVDWDIAIKRMEAFIAGRQQVKEDLAINAIRQMISDSCKQRAQDSQGIYTLTVPTGGGKTYASLRYALHHAKQHRLERIIYVIPYTSIIEQNADAIRKVIEAETDEFPWVLEHHSNLEPETQTWHSKLAAENWDAPIVLTTMVQFLETCFGAGTRGVRRLHQLANSVLIFDEVQTLPINCVHLFCNALNFLVYYAKATAVLCTATQPLLNQLPESVAAKGQLAIPKDNEIIDDVSQLFDQLKRVDIRNRTKPGGWTLEEISELALSEFQTKGNCLAIVNTKAWAQALYLKCSDQVGKDSLFHLSTHQCSTHRTDLFRQMRERLDNKLPVLCFSTQLIEAGVDIDFASVIRFLAGLDSIAQAAGRCNRNGLQETATVHVVNPEQETIDQLIDIKEGKKQTQRIFDEMKDKDLLAPEPIALYFDYYFYQRADQMAYPLIEKEAGGRKDALLNLLSDNDKNTAKGADLQLKQSFMTAAKAFKAIDAPTHSVIVPYGQGKALIEEMCAISKKYNSSSYYNCLRKAQSFSVNIFPSVWKQLREAEAVHEIQGEGVFYLDKNHYSPEFGLSIEPTGKVEAIVL